MRKNPVDVIQCQCAHRLWTDCASCTQMKTNILWDKSLVKSLAFYRQIHPVYGSHEAILWPASLAIRQPRLVLRYINKITYSMAHHVFFLCMVLIHLFVTDFNSMRIQKSFARRWCRSGCHDIGHRVDIHPQAIASSFTLFYCCLLLSMHFFQILHIYYLRLIYSRIHDVTWFLLFFVCLYYSIVGLALKQSLGYLHLSTLFVFLWSVFEWSSAFSPTTESTRLHSNRGFTWS